MDSKQIQKTLKEISDSFTIVGVIAAVLTTALGAFLSDESAKLYAWGITILIVLVIVGRILYQKRRASKAEHPPSTEVPSPKAVLRGLLPFEDGDDLPSRTGDVQQLYTLVSGSAFRFGVLWGESGCGKTSLLRAGLVPRLREEGYVPLYATKPTKDPRKAIRETLAKESLEMAEGLDKDLKVQLSDTVYPDKERVIVILDQFEEFFLLNRTPRSRAHFIKWLGEAVHQADLPVAFLICVRADSFAQLQSFAPHIEEPTSVRTTIQLHNLYKDQAKTVLEGAAEADGIDFDSGLADAVANDLEVEDIVRPAELQIVGTRMKRQNILRLSQYEAAGRARGILSSFISDEIKRSANPQIARLILRSLCAETGEAKSPVDLGLEEIIDVIEGPQQSAEERFALNPGEVQSVLRHFVNARILIQTDEHKYNLVHDYLALHVHIATKDVETNTERANRLLRRYLADYTEDNRTRVPGRVLREIRRYASPKLKNSEEAHELLRKSRQSNLMRLVQSFAIPAVILIAWGGLYLLLKSSYYLSTEFVDGWDQRAFRIVVRNGHPKWKSIPGFDDVAIETDFTVQDIAGDNRGDIYDESLTGSWSAEAHGYQAWVEPLVERLSSANRARTLCRLGQPEDAADFFMFDLAAMGSGSGDTWRALLEAELLYPGFVTPEMVNSLAEFSLDETQPFAMRGPVMEFLITLAQLRSQPSMITPDFVEALNSTIQDPEWECYEVEEAARVLLHVGQLQSQPSIVTSEAVQAITRIGLGKAECPYPPGYVMYFLQQLVRFNPTAVDPQVIQSLTETALDSTGSPDVSGGAALVLGQLAQARPQALTLTTGLVWSVISPTITLEDKGYELPVSAESALNQLVRADPRIVTDDMVRLLSEMVSDSSQDSSVRMKAGLTLSLLASADPALSGLMTPEVLQEMFNVLEDPVIGPYLATDIAAQLAKGNSKGVMSKLIEILISDVSDDYYSTKLDVLDALDELLQVDPECVTPESIEALLITLRNPELDIGDRTRLRRVLVRIVQSNPETATSELARVVFGIAAGSDSPYDLRVEAATALVHIANAKPGTADPEAVQQIISSLVREFNLDSPATPTVAELISLSEFTQALPALIQLAKVKPEIAKAEIVQAVLSYNQGLLDELAGANPDAITSEEIHILLGDLESEHMSTRQSAIHALFYLAIGSSRLKEQIREELAISRASSPLPHARVAASRALEMIALSDWIEDVWSHPERLESIKSRLTLIEDRYRSYPESDRSKHIQLAASRILEQVEWYEESIK